MYMHATVIGLRRCVYVYKAIITIKEVICGGSGEWGMGGVGERKRG